MGTFVVADSVTSAGHRLTTLLITYPRRMVITGTNFTTGQLDAVIWPDETLGEDRAGVLDGIHTALGNSDPALVHDGGVHLPFLLLNEVEHHNLSQLTMISAARVDRIGTTYGVAADVRYYQAMITAEPPRMNALDHVCVPGDDPESGFDGWIRVRHLFERRGVEWL